MNRSFIRLLWLACAFVLSVLMCISVGAETEIGGIYLTGSFDVSAGKTPSEIQAPSDAPYIVTAVWEKYDKASASTVPHSGPFELGCTYYLNITAEPKAGYCFPLGGTPLYVNGEYRDTVGYSEGALSYIFTFETDDYIRSVTLTGIPEIKASNAADLCAVSADVPFCSVSGEFFVFDVSEGAFVPFDGCFAQGYEYRLSLKLKFESGYHPSPDAFIVRVLGREYYDVQYSDGMILCDIRYSLSSVIECVELFGITAPTAGETASLSGLTFPAGAHYTAETAMWSMYNGSLYVSVDKFDYGKTYGLDIILRADAGYAFAESVSFYINGEKLTERSGSGQYLYIYEEYTTETLISAVRIKPDPIKSGASSASFKVSPFLTSNPKFTIEYELIEHVIGGESYVMDGETFHAAGIYEIRVTLTAKEGSCFSDATKIYETTKLITAESVSARVCTLSFYRPLAQTVECISLVGVIAPKGGELPSVDTVTAEQSGYCITDLRYLEYDEKSGKLVPFEGCFKAGRTYALRAEAECEFGWALIGSSTAFYIDGECASDTEASYTSAAAYRFFTAEEGECAGDVDHDGTLTNADIALLVRVLSGWQTSVSAECADIDKNGIKNNRDVIALVRMLN